MKTRFAKVLVVCLIVASLSVNAFAIPSINGLFNTDSDKIQQTYANAYGWNTSKMDDLEWQASVDGSNVTFKRQNGYQKEYYQDLYDTTAKYIGLGGGGRGGTGANIVAVARAEVGESEIGDTNNVKYNTWYYGSEVSGDSYPWCCAFVSWCANECGYIDTGLFSKTAGCAFQYQHFQEMGFDTYKTIQTAPMGGVGVSNSNAYVPVPGDIAFFYDGSDNPPFTHIGIVSDVGSDYITLIEGNSSNAVRENTYTQTTGRADFRAGWIVHVIYPESDPSSPQADVIFNYLTGVVGLNNAGACGILGNMNQESRCIPDTIEGGYTWETGAGYGLIQWTNTNGNSRTSYIGTELPPGSEFYPQSGLRRTNLVSWCNCNGYDYHTASGQLAFLFEYEIPTYSTYSNALESIRNVPDTAQGAQRACEIWLEYVEGCPRSAGGAYGWSVNINLRGGFTSEFWATYGNS